MYVLLIAMLLHAIPSGIASQTYDSGTAEEQAETVPSETVEQTPALEKQARAKSGEPPPPPPTFQQRHQRELLALLALLFLWLFTRVWVTPESEQPKRKKRHSPVNAEELARVTYSIVQSEDGEGYRGLYLNGAEAVRAMGEAPATSYIEGRSAEIFEAAFDQLFERVPPGARFEQGSLTEKDVVELWVIATDGRRHKIPIGTIVHVGAIMRLAAPVTGIEANPAIELLPE